MSDFYAQNIPISLPRTSDAIAKATTSDRSLIFIVHKEIDIYSCLFFIDSDFVRLKETAFSILYTLKLFYNPFIQAMSGSQYQLWTPFYEDESPKGYC